MPSIDFSVKGAQAVVAAYEATGKAAERAKKTNDALAGSMQLTGKEAAKLDRLQQEIARRHESAESRYQRSLAETRKALKGHADEANLLAKERTRLTLEYLRLADRERKTADDRRRESQEAKRRATELRLELAKLPPLLKQAADEAGDMADAIDLGAAAAGKTNEELLGIKTSSEGAFGAGALKRLMAWGAGWVSVQGMVRAVTDEMKAQQEMIDKRTAAQMTVSESRNVVLRNMVGEKPETIKAMQTAADKISSATGVSEVFVNQGLAEAYSASGGNAPASISAVEAITKFLRDQPADIGQMSGSVLDLSKVTGTTDANTNLGLLALTGKLGRVVKPHEQSENIAPALVGSLGFGLGASDAGALFAALSSGGADFQGRRTGTGQIRLLEQLRDFSVDTSELEKSRAEAEERVRTALTKRMAAGERLQNAKTPRAQQAALKSFETANAELAKHSKSMTQLGGALLDEKAAAASLATAKTMPERIALLQRNPALAQRFMAGAEFEAKVQVPIEDLLLRPNSPTAQMYRDFRAQIPGNAGLAAIGQEAVTMPEKYNTLEPVAARIRAMKNAVEQIQTGGDKRYSISTEERDLMKTLAMEVGEPGLIARVNDFTQGVGDGVAGESVPRLIEQIERAKTLNRDVMRLGPLGVPAIDDSQLTPEQRRRDEVFDKLLEVMRLVEENTRPDNSTPASGE